MKINLEKKLCTVDGQTYKEMDWFTLNGSTGNIYNKQLKLSSAQLNQNKYFDGLMALCKNYNNVLVRANADSENDAKIAKKLGAKGIGLCRTEHMFFNPKRIHEVRKMIVALNKRDKISALNKLLKFQTADFYKIFKAMSPYPVTVRLLDPPLHEFLPNQSSQIKQLAKDLKISVSALTQRIDNLKEGNPMLGHRGCRLGITFPELTIMQTKAILAAANKLSSENIKTKPEIMIPLVGTVQEFLNQKNIIDETAALLSKQNSKSTDYLVGTMIELPRACFIADQIAKHAHFISFGTNDLTQTTFGFSRDDVGSFLPQYLNLSILKNDPFASLDKDGVGELIKIAITKATKINPKIKIGICGEHGGDSKSIDFFNQLNFNYVSCSPFRIPIAYLAIAKNNC